MVGGDLSNDLLDGLDDELEDDEDDIDELPHMAVTNVFVRQPSGEWLLTHHHSSPYATTPCTDLNDSA
jgi:hypothetical protein